MHYVCRLILPLMQSYSQAGDFTVLGKLRSAIIDNAIYYGSYLLIFGILLVYIAASPDLQLDGQVILFYYICNSQYFAYVQYLQAQTESDSGDDE